MLQGQAALACVAEQAALASLLQGQAALSSVLQGQAALVSVLQGQTVGERREPSNNNVLTLPNNLYIEPYNSASKKQTPPQPRPSTPAYIILVNSSRFVFVCYSMKCFENRSNSLMGGGLPVVNKIA